MIEAAPPRTSAAVRQRLIETLIDDLIGPTDDRAEALGMAPSRFYLTGFLASCNGSREVEKPPETEAALAFEFPEDPDDEDAAEAPVGRDEAPDPAARKVGRLPSSIGLSLLLAPGTQTLAVEARWADYVQAQNADGPHWVRQPRLERLELSFKRRAGHVPVPNSGGLEIHWALRAFNTEGSGLETGTLSVAVFLVNARPSAEGARDGEFVFQAALALTHPAGFTPRPDWHARNAGERDARVADLQYRDEREWAVGHGVSATATLDPDGRCRRIETAWIPYADVEKVEPAPIPGLELGMEALGQAPDAAALEVALAPLTAAYAAWIAEQATTQVGDVARVDIRDDLVRQMRVARTRIAKGVAALGDPVVRECFQRANLAMARAARQRDLVAGKPPTPPTWRPFQLAFILMALPGLLDPRDADRETVDLLFFPTGGGKTEAYLGLAAITLLYRRFRHPETSGAGVAVLMRYTLRLLTLDQLGRATALICALELMRRAEPERLGAWPFEIGLWIGQGGTPNRLGKKGDANEHSAYARLRLHQDDPARHGAPLPLAVCPWCDTALTKTSFVLEPATEPRRLRVRCGKLGCDFLDGLPLVGVDEEVYRRLPGFVIATVDKFAALPWEGRAGTLFGNVERRDAEGFYGPCDEGQGVPLPGRALPPPDLIIQDELHLISGPLGTMVGLYEAAIEELCRRPIDGVEPAPPKIVASTATVRRAEAQIKGLFGRSAVAIFPPPGPDRRNSFFAVTRPADEVPARRYIGIAARGRSFKVVQLRVGIALLSAAQRLYEQQPRGLAPNPADPYMTLLGYFSSLRELGGARRIYEDEIRKRVAAYGDLRKRFDEKTSRFADRDVGEIGELTSRVSTTQIADAKDRLSRAFGTGRSLDVALATNMIAVGLDVSRLGLMVVTGQPISTSEYIQATSRVGRDEHRPGLVVTLFNPMRPRDRSHYERFGHFHRTYYRQVETTSVTPFSLRALDRGLAGALVGLIRHAEPGFAKPDGFKRARHASGRLKVYAERLSKRAASEAERQELVTRIGALIDDWDGLATDMAEVVLYYNKAEARGGSVLGVLHDPLAEVPEGLNKAQGKKFRAQRSLRDVESVSNVWIKVIGQAGYLEDENG